MTECIEADGHRLPKGYVFKAIPAELRRRYGLAKPSYAHRVAWIEAHGPIPEGMVVDHRCKNPACVNLDHLRLVTKQQSNAERWADHGGVGDELVCRHGHVGERAQTKRGTWYCRACNREAQRRRRQGGG